MPRGKFSLAKVNAPHFCAGLEIHDVMVYNAAPILKYMIGWTADRVRRYCQSKGWTFEILEEKS